MRHGEGIDVRDLRTDDRIAITERVASRTAVAAGTRFCARVVSDGSGGWRIVGAVLPVADEAEAEVRELLDIGDGSLLLGWAARHVPVAPAG